MKTTPKTAAIVRALRNRTSYAATLARWQSRRPAALLAAIRDLGSYAGSTLAKRRAYALHYKSHTPELSAPDSPTPVLWFDGTSSPDIAHHWAGREVLKNRGWYTDDDQSDTFEAYAVQLVDFPGIIFEAIRTSCNDAIRVNLADFHAIDYREADCNYSAALEITVTARAAIRSADSTAEREAEEEREYQERYRHETDLEDARHDLHTIREEFRALAAELRSLCPSALATTYPAAAAAIRAQVAAILHRRRETLDTIAEHKAALA